MACDGNIPALQTSCVRPSESPREISITLVDDVPPRRAAGSAANGVPVDPTGSAVSQVLAIIDAAPNRSPIARQFGADPLPKSASFAFRGARAEVALAETLDWLGTDWTVLSQVRVTAADAPLEYVLVGPPGVFTVTLHNHAADRVWVGERTVIVDAKTYPYIREAEAARSSVVARLSELRGKPVLVTPCILLAEPASIEFGMRPRGIEVMDALAFAQWLHDLPRLFSAQAVEKVTLIARAEGTWAGTGVSDVAGHDQFRQLEHDIARAHRRRLVWVIVAAGLSQTAVAWLITRAVIGSLGLV
ncbi:MAG: hypothetical protein JWO10_87 [Microbacteriaceae bacterium]|nr:hypothetical protein [Microbacteriaceae bacterium]